MNERPVIGIIGGMGPAAGFDLANKITRLTRATGDPDHLPVILMSLPGEIPDRTRFLLTGEGENPGHAISSIALRLEAAGATVTGIPCNTAHAPPIIHLVKSRLHDSGSAIRLLNMIDETVAWISRTVEAASRIAVLSTSGVRQTHLYSQPLIDAGFTVLQLDEDTHQRLITDALYSPLYGLKAVSPPDPQARAQVVEALATLRKDGAAIAILGCTELPLAVPETEWDGLALIDPTEILARALIRETYPERLIPDQS